MLKRIFLFVLTNIFVVFTLTFILNIIGVTRYLYTYGINLQMLAIFCLIWGMGGALISLAISKFTAKLFMGVKVIEKGDPNFSEIYDIVEILSKRAGLPKTPEVGIYESPEINAFATGPSKGNALVAVSTGLLKRMDREQIEGVIGHEISHIANGDMVTMTLIQGVINAFVMFLARILAFIVNSFLSKDRDEEGGIANPFLTYFLIQVFEVVFSFLGLIVVAFFSRIREFKADEGGAKLAGKQKMIEALKELQRVYEYNLQFKNENEAINTLKISGKKGGLFALFATHPPLEERIKRLESMQII
ncbi:MAG: protease HtpX [Brevinematales bacterium]|nr:protease HtpX [Brevinematales bacterium]